jgi:Metallo-beta-lactamase superfamily
LVAHRALTDGARDQDWALIDAELFRTKALIRSRRGASVWSRRATLGNHSHSRAFRPCRRFEDLAEEWDAPVYAHSLEHPYLNGTLSYPPPDPTVGGGLMAVSASLFPRGPVDVSEHLRMLPEDGSVPHMRGWRWVPTPGHSPGHISLWRDRDRTLVAGDAFVTTRQESVYAALTQEPEMHGPPMYYTPSAA